MTGAIGGHPVWAPGAYPAETLRVVGLALHRWRTSDAPGLLAAVESSQEHLRPWMPWAARYDGTAAADYTASCESAWTAREHFDYRIATPDDAGDAQHVLGSASLMTRVGPGALEIGYWVRHDRVRLGVATRAAAALTVAGFGLPGVTRIEIHHDICNSASAGIPERLGFRRSGDYCRIPGAHPDGTAAGETGLLVVWTMRADELPGSPAEAIASKDF